MLRQGKTKIALAVLGLGWALSAHAGDNAWSVFSGSAASSARNWTVNTYTPDPSRYGPVPSMDEATPGTADGDAAYARRMRAAYAKNAVTYSTAPAEAALRQKSMSSNPCRGIVETADAGRKSYVVRHMAPDPTQVIKSSTCFVDVLKINIPRTSFSFVNTLVSQLSKLAGDSMCNSTTGYWSNIANAAATGNFSKLSSQAISAGTGYVAQPIYQAPTSGSGSGSGQWEVPQPQPGATAPVNGGWVVQPTTTTAPAPSGSGSTSLLGSLSGLFGK